MATRKAPNYLCKEFEKILRLTGVDQYDGLSHGVNKKLMDVDLVNAMCNALATQNNSIAENITALRIKEHGVMAGSVTDLLESYYCSKFYKRRLIDDVGYLRERVAISHFYLIAEKPAKIILKLVFRVPDTQANAVLIVKLNETEVASIEPSCQWKVMTIILPEHLIMRNVNVITLHWPLHSRTIILNENDEITLSQLNDTINPIFGEIHQFEAGIE
jgi:hypothetical protein